MEWMRKRLPETQNMRANACGVPRMIAIVILLAILIYSATPFITHPPDAITYSLEKEHKRPQISPYHWAEAITGAPATILKAIAITESDERDDVPGDGGISLGRFQINETFREWNVKRYGPYDPTGPYQAAILAGKKYQDNLSALGTPELAIAAHRQGAAGVLHNGPSLWYIERVYRSLYLD